MGKSLMLLAGVGLMGLAGGCVSHLPPGGAEEWHTRVGFPPFVKLTTDNTGIKVTEKRIVAAEHKSLLQILGFEIQNDGKNVVLANPEEPKK